jgi:cell division protein ZapA
MTLERHAAEADPQISLDVSLLGRAYKVACKESERTDLMDAVALVDRRMREIRDTGRIAGSERIAVMAALNIAHDLQRMRKEARGTQSTPGTKMAGRLIDDAGTRRRIVTMQSVIDEVLADGEKAQSSQSSSK